MKAKVHPDESRMTKYNITSMPRDIRTFHQRSSFMDQSPKKRATHRVTIIPTSASDLSSQINSASALPAALNPSEVFSSSLCCICSPPFCHSNLIVSERFNKPKLLLTEIKACDNPPTTELSKSFSYMCRGMRTDDQYIVATLYGQPTIHRFVSPWCAP
jgi:hypothetical protein